MAIKKSFRKSTTVANNDGIKAGRYNGVIVGVAVYERLILKDTQYENAGDIVPEFTPIVAVDTGEGKIRIETFYGIKNKFSRGKSNNSKGFNLILGIEDLTDAETEALIKNELTDEDGTFEFGWFFSKEVTAVFELNKAGDRANLVALKQPGKNYERPALEGVEIPEFTLSFINGEGKMWRQNLYADLDDELLKVEKNVELLDKTTASIIED